MFLAFGMAVLLAGRHASAQLVTGQVVDGATGLPVAGAMLVAIGDGEAVGGRGVTDEQGNFALDLEPSFELSRVQIVRFGYRTESYEADALSPNGPSVLSIAVAPLELAGLEAVAENLCREAFTSGGPVYDIWLEARKSLAVAEFAESRALSFEAVRFERRLSVEDRAQLEDGLSETRVITAEKPYLSLSAEQMTETGWVGQIEQDRGAELVYYAPDASVLLSEAFTSQHCFGADVASGSIILRFTPHPSRSGIPDIEGEILLDQETLELTELRFRFVDLPLPTEAGTLADGEVRFFGAPNGVRIVREWAIRMPVLRATGWTLLFDDGRRAPEVVAEHISEVGGRILSIDFGDGRLELHEPPRVVLHGRVEDAASESPIDGVLIRSADSPSMAVSDSLGAFTIELDGEPPFVLAAEQLGYQTTMFELPDTAPTQLSVLWLPPVSVEPRVDGRIVRADTVAGQEEPDASDGVVISGRVEDALSANPLSGVLIRRADSPSMAVSDSLGAFTIELDGEPPFVLTAEQLGYQTTVFELPDQAPTRLSVLELSPSPIEIEGVTVVGEAAMEHLMGRLTLRRRAYSGSSRVMYSDALLESGAGSAFDLVSCHPSNDG